MAYPAPLRFLLISLLLLLAPPSLADDPSFESLDWSSTHGGLHYNATHDRTRVLCVYPLSGQYCLLNRLLYYALIVFIVTCRSHVWLVTGALAYVLTYSSTAAVHAIVLAAVSAKGLLDVDILGTWVATSVGSLAVVPMFVTSKRIRESIFGPVFGFWGTLVSVGALCSIVCINREYPDEPECRSITGSMGLLTSESQLLDPGFNCSYTCFSYNQPLRAASEITVIPKSLAFEHFTIINKAEILTFFFGVMIGLFGCCCCPAGTKSTKAELREVIRENRERIGDPPICKLRRMKRAARNSAKKELRTGKVEGNGGCEICWAVLGYLSLIVVIILNEIFLLAYDGGFPYDEHPYAVGQWGPWAGVLVALIAAWIVKVRKPNWEERQKILAAEASDEEDPATASQTGSDQRPTIDQVDTVAVPSQGGDSSNIDLEDPKGIPDFRQMSFVWAAGTGNVGSVWEHLSKGLQKEVETKHGADVLSRAAGNGCEAVVRMLLEEGADVDAKDSTGLTTLIRAAWAGHEPVVRLLLEKGATTNGHQGQVALHRALANHRNGVAQLLQDHGARAFVSDVRDVTDTRAVTESVVVTVC